MTNVTQPILDLYAESERLLFETTRLRQKVREHDEALQAELRKIATLQPGDRVIAHNIPANLPDSRVTGEWVVAYVECAYFPGFPGREPHLAEWPYGHRIRKDGTLGTGQPRPIYNAEKITRTEEVPS